jgi:pentose-5-phosphate-3-epimerase
MIQVTVHVESVQKVLEIVNELRTQGMIQGQDFDFAYQSHLWESIANPEEKSAVFTFYTEKYATLFALKYGN